jgi:putative FmdB family regulatory protein
MMVAQRGHPSPRQESTMPIYEYECPEHGLFEELRPMQRSSEDAPCPQCDGSAPRVLSATRTNLVPRAVSIAHGRNEKSQHAPALCSHGQQHPSTRKKPRSDRLHAYHGKRPWVMEHG